MSWSSCLSLCFGSFFLFNSNVVFVLKLSWNLDQEDREDNGREMLAPMVLAGILKAQDLATYWSHRETLFKGNAHTLAHAQMHTRPRWTQTQCFFLCFHAWIEYIDQGCYLMAKVTSAPWSHQKQRFEEKLESRGNKRGSCISHQRISFE